MICPNCTRNLLQRERARRRCHFCRKEFALDPKRDGVGLHDVRIRKLTGKLGDEGRLTVTGGQLRYALQQRGHPPQAFRGDRGSACSLIGFAVVASVAAIAFQGSLAVGLGLVVLTLIGLAVRQLVLASVPAPPGPVEARWTTDGFRMTVLDRWRAVYGALPPGLVEDELVRPGPPPAEPAFALLCPDPTVRAFLHVNRYPERHRALLVGELRAVPAGLPLVVLHNASPRGCLLAAEARAARPGLRVLDAGLSVRAVLVDQAKYVLLREDPDRAEEWRPRLARELPGLSASQREWFAEGWWSPLAALPPKRLMAVADQAAERITAPAAGPVAGPVGLLKSPAAGPHGQPETPAETRRRALALGFLSWPEAGPTQKGTG
ncbi:hypothetical protein [Kitasatospora sp. NPDC093806]|uniref:hypothetical protein n=1 Tax=Kitasatospora sp. NPDC093806 TaxID=3155075 RepID=UPI0034320348